MVEEAIPTSDIVTPEPGGLSPDDSRETYVRNTAVMTVGTALSSHPDIDMMSFTGSTRAGIQVAKNAADTVKRVAQELGGKSANIVLDDADLKAAVTGWVPLLQRFSGAIVQHGRKQEGPRYRRPSCLSRFIPEGQRPTAALIGLGVTVAWSERA